MIEESWQYKQYKQYETLKQHVIIDNAKIIKKWQPVIDYNITDKDVKLLVRYKLSEFLELYSMVDYERPEIAYSPTNPKPYVNGIGAVYSNNNTIQNNRYIPNGWIDLPDALNLIVEKIFNYVQSSSEINLEIVKEYYNVVTGKRTLLLKDLDNERIIIDYKLKKEYENKIFNLIDDQILFILDPAKRERINRKNKIQSLLNIE